MGYVVKMVTVIHLTNGRNLWRERVIKEVTEKPCEYEKRWYRKVTGKYLGESRVGFRFIDLEALARRNDVK